ncbi:MAG: cupin domain-containing protein [Bacteroidetes bacterium]|nr:cupin domain-containing protein [Bacteroidota bacterium]
MKTVTTFLTAAFAATFLLFGCNTETKDAPPASDAVDSTAVTAAPAAEAAIPDSMDVAKNAPNVYKLLADSLGLRLFEIEFEPGETAALHMHPDNAVYVTEGGTLEVTGADGKKMVYELKPGMGMIFGPETHSATNTGKTTVKAVFVEVRRPR